MKKFILLLPLISGGIVMGCLAYCYLWWTPHPMGPGDPDCSVICWLFCRTMNPLWFYMGILFSSISILACIMLRHNKRDGRLITLIAGILLIPTGMLNFIAYYYVPKLSDFQ